MTWIKLIEIFTYVIVLSFTFCNLCQEKRINVQSVLNDKTAMTETIKTNIIEYHSKYISY